MSFSLWKSLSPFDQVAWFHVFMWRWTSAFIKSIFYIRSPQHVTNQLNQQKYLKIFLKKWIGSKWHGKPEMAQKRRCFKKKDFKNLSLIFFEHTVSNLCKSLWKLKVTLSWRSDWSLLPSTMGDHSIYLLTQRILSLLSSPPSSSLPPWVIIIIIKRDLNNQNSVSVSLEITCWHFQKAWFTKFQLAPPPAQKQAPKVAQNWAKNSFLRFLSFSERQR